jgi:hypothetical protein
MYTVSIAAIKRKGHKLEIINKIGPHWKHSDFQGLAIGDSQKAGLQWSVFAPLNVARGTKRGTPGLKIMATALRITFDSNVWRPLVSPTVFPNDPDTGHFQVIYRALQQKAALGYLSDTVFTLEAIKRTFRKTFFGDYRGRVKMSTETVQKDVLHTSIVLGPDPSRSATNSPHLSKHWQDALGLGFKLLRCTRIAGIGNSDLLDWYYAPDDRVLIDQRQVRMAQCSRDIETQGWGIKHIKDLGNKYANGGFWLDGIKNAPASADGLIAKAVAEWADGDAVAVHFGYGNDYFCTRDTAKVGGPTSVLSASNRAWLSQKYQIQFVTPEDLAKTLATSRSGNASNTAS